MSLAACVTDSARSSSTCLIGLGQGKRSDSSGVYTGAFSEGKRHGKGSMVSHLGVRQHGTWCRGIRQGEAHQTYADGSAFVGVFLGDEKAGAGEFIDGVRSVGGGDVVYAGAYAAGERHGDAAAWGGVYGDRYTGRCPAGVGMGRTQREPRGESPRGEPSRREPTREPHTREPPRREPPMSLASPTTDRRTPQ